LGRETAVFYLPFLMVKEKFFPTLETAEVTSVDASTRLTFVVEAYSIGPFAA
jgi:hypothetical protein